MEEIPIDYVRRILDRMRAGTKRDDVTGQRMIRKYERLLREEIERQARGRG
jgi:hypothetical protein